MADAICTEIKLRRDYLDTPRLETIYFGGGTPSLLTTPQLARVFDTIYQCFSVDANAEVTLEANPDDLTKENLRRLRGSPVNRLSIGIQSFHEPHLRYMNRVHNAVEAENCVKNAQNAGFENLTIDLIYGIPHSDHSAWESDLQKALACQVPHISAYCLTIEPQTVFGRRVKQQKMPNVDEDFGAVQFEMLVETLEVAGYEQYEISNFAQNGQYARHNSGYWLQKHYLGVGPSAHSFNGHSRHANVANNAVYLKAISQGEIAQTTENLSTTDQINDYLLTSLRTRWGTDLAYIRNRWQHDLQATNSAYLQKALASNWLTLRENTLHLTKPGKLFADEITAALLVINRL